MNISTARQFYWSVRRELWEHRSIFLVPLAIAVLIVIASLISTFQMPGRMEAASLDMAQPHKVLESPYIFASLLLMFSTMIVGAIYCLDALYGERRDRTVLFWKSLPVSDTTTVLAKASIPIVILPLVTFGVTVVTHILMLLVGSVRMVGSGMSMGAHMSFFHLWLMLLIHLVIGHGLWWAPYWGWMLLVSAWARRAPLLWASLPLIAITLLERIAFNTNYFASMLLNRIAGGDHNTPPGDAMSMAIITVHPSAIWTSVSFWMGLIVTAGMLVLAARLRRYREPI